MEPKKIFISYSHKDEDLRKELEKHLQILKRDGLIKIWKDRCITAGSEFKNRIDDNLKDSHIILLLVSSDFISSDYCYDIELAEALKLHENKQAVVIPIILRECSWIRSPFSKLMALPTDGLPIKSNNWFDLDAALANVSRGIEEAILSIDQNESKQRRATPFASAPIENFQKTIEIFKQESEKLNFNSSKEDFENLDNLRRELYTQLIGNLDQKISNTPSLRDESTHRLFDKIFTSEILDPITINDIQRLRFEKDKYKWYERKIIINALTLSLLNFKKFDKTKVDLLLDFLTDFEMNVWESALCGIVITLLHHLNKWTRFDDLNKRLQTLQHLENVQSGLRILEVIFRTKSYKESTFHTQLYHLPFFDRISNCFLPFYEDNPVVQSALNNNATAIDSKEFTGYINSMPFLDCYKYTLAFCLESGAIRKVSSVKRKEEMYRNYIISNAFHPYQNLIAEYYHFLAFCPKSKTLDVFVNELSIAKTKLKNIILDKTNALRLSAESLISENKYAGAITLLQDLLKIEPNDVEALVKIAQCYIEEKRPDYSQAINHLTAASNVDPNNAEVFSLMGVCHSLQNDGKKALVFFLKAKSIRPKVRRIIKNLGDCYHGNEDYHKAIEIYQEGIEIYPKEFEFYQSIGACYQSLKQYHKALESYDKALSLCGVENIPRLHIDLCDIYTEMLNSDNAIKYGLAGLKIDPKNYHLQMMIGRAYLICKIDLGLARKHLEKSISLKKLNITYGNLGHLELCEKNDKKAMEHYQICALMFDDIEGFIWRFDFDLPYITRLGVPAEKYNSIKESICKYWEINKKQGSK
jgi:tetratricopeptide (TPR) repeat protein